MPGTGGLSIANDRLANDILGNLARNGSLLHATTERLSRGLRIASAADDPSGLAISESLLSQVYGFDQGARNVQDAANAAVVADGALGATTEILQRIRTLAVEGASDVSSGGDRAHLQTEIAELLREVDRISSATSFNGASLLDGSHAGFRAEVDALVDLTGNALLVAPQFATASSLVSAVAFGATDSTIADGTIELQVAQLSATRQAVAVSFYDAQRSGVGYSAVLTVGANGVVGATGQITVDAVQITFAPGISTNDVGSSAFLRVSAYVSAAQNMAQPAFSLQSGALEGQALPIAIAATSTAILRIANVNLIATTGTLAAQDAIGAIDRALTLIGTQRAALGAAIVRLQEEGRGDDVASENLQASASAIRDLDVARETTVYTRLRIIGELGTSMLAQSHGDAELLLGLFPGTSAARAAAGTGAIPTPAAAPPRAR